MAYDNGAASPGSSDRNFGFVFSAVFGLIGFYPLLHGGPLRAWALGLAALFLIATLVRPAILSPLNRLWTRFGLLLHRVMSPIALFVVFCLGILPTALVLRALGKDPLRLRFDPSAGSYWIPRKPPGRSDEQMKKQF
jgi:hypothetical protein